MSAVALLHARKASKAKAKAELPPPLVKATHHPLRWVKNTVLLLVASVILAHIGKLIVTGTYYGLFETWKPMTDAWHHLVNSGYTRHLIRDVGEGFLGGFLAQQIVWNHYKVKDKKLHLLDRAEIALHIPNIKCKERLTALQLACSPLLAILYAVPGFLLAILAVKYIHHLDHHAVAFAQAYHAPPTYWQKVKAIDTGSWDKVLVGLFASAVFGRRPMRKVFDDVQLYFAETRKLAGKPNRLWHVPTYKARVNGLEVTDRRKALVAKHHSTVLTAALSGGLVVGLALAAFGYYVLTVIAHP